MIKKLLFFALLLLSVTAYSQNSEPVGRPERENIESLYSNFVTPPKGYGQVPFYWWMGDTLTKEHLLGHLEILKDKSITSLQVNYAHSDQGGKSWGLTFKSQPEIFTEEWWELFGWFLKEAKKRGMTVSLSDYTLGVGQEQFVDDALKAHPEITGSELGVEKKTISNESVSWELSYCPLSLVAYPINADSTLDESRKVDLTNAHKELNLEWKTPDSGEWMIVNVYRKLKLPSYDPMHPLSGKIYIDNFFQRFEDRFADEFDGGINFFFSDELDFKLNGLLWNDYIASEFIKRKGYDITPHLPALFENIGDFTAKYRLDFNDIMVSLCEENFFKPVYDWHEERGLTYGCDHGGRGLRVAEFGDYFRTQRWNQAPGCDQPGLSSNIIKNKVASSIAHMYERPRTWLEGFYGSGWGTSSAMVTKAIFKNFVQGQNLLSLHGLYYSTPAARWEWAPPCNHFRMPYWEHLPDLLECSERLSYILSQGYHAADVALLYPVEPEIAGDGGESVKCAFAIGKTIYEQGIDFDFMDYQSLHRAEVVGDKLSVSGENFSILIIPSMKSIKYKSLEKALEFHNNGGIVLCVDQIPQYTDMGKVDSEMTAKLKAFKTISSDQVLSTIKSSIVLDFHTSSPLPDVMHRKMDHRDLYAVYNVPKGEECFFRAKGSVELWDPWSGEYKDITPSRVDENGTYIKMPLDTTEVQIIVFDPTKQKNQVTAKDGKTINSIDLGSSWTAKVLPSQNNLWGDYHWPETNELLGAEINSVRYSSEASSNWNSPEFNDSNWEEQTCSYSTKFLFSGALKEPLNMETILNNNLFNKWAPYAYSIRWGVEKDPGHQGYHGLKLKMYDEFIRLGAIADAFRGTQRIADPEGNYYYLYTTVIASKSGYYTWESGAKLPTEAYLNGEKMDLSKTKVYLKRGENTLLLHYDTHCTTYLVFKDPYLEGEVAEETLAEQPISLSWNGRLDILPYELNSSNKRGYYRFNSAPGLESLTFTAFAGSIKCWADGESAKVVKGAVRKDGATQYNVILPKTATKGATIAIEASDLVNGMRGGAIFPYTIAQNCGWGELPLTDWGEVDGLEIYSGGMHYKKEVEISNINPKSRYELDFEDVVSSVEVWVNGKKVGVRLAAPWKFDITKYLKNGTNEIEAKVYNTAQNFYRTIPSRYSRRAQKSGIMGKAVIIERQ